jgi:hypothetical protein
MLGLFGEGIRAMSILILISITLAQLLLIVGARAYFRGNGHGPPGEATEAQD